VTNHLEDPAVRGFVVNGRDITDRRHAEDVLRESEARFRRLVEAVSAPLQLEGREVQIGASIGIALDSNGQELIESVVQDADFALYRAKDNGRGRVELSDPSVSRGSHRSSNGSMG
jgi:diguanylate cyclase (GGDEF)-like protein